MKEEKENEIGECYIILLSWRYVFECIWCFKDNKKTFEMFLDAYNLEEKKDSALSLGIMHSTVFDS